MSAKVKDRIYIHCPKCGAIGGCRKHGITPSGINLRTRPDTEGNKA